MELLRSSIRFPPNGIADVTGTVRHPFSGLPIPILDAMGADGLGGISYHFDHFFHAVGRIPAAEGALGLWTLSGTTGAATVTFGATRIGEITLTGDSTSGCNPTLQLGTASAPTHFIYAVGKRMWVHARLKLVTVATTEVIFGLMTPDTSPTVTGTLPSDGIFFHKASTATKYSFQARKDGTGTDKANVSGTLVDDTYTIIGFFIDEIGNIFPYQDGSVIAAGVIPAGTANIPVTADVMQPAIGILGASMTATLDWVLFAQDN